jgi:hypothetical protein
MDEYSWGEVKAEGRVGTGWRRAMGGKRETIVII